MRNLLILFCSVIVFCACASQTQSTQKADKDELNLNKLKAECEKNNAKSCYELGDFFVEESGRYESEKDKLFDDRLLNLAKTYFLKSCDLKYGDGCYSYAMALGFSGLNELNSAEKENEKLAMKKLSKYLPTFVKYNQKACDLGSANGCNELGLAYQNGDGVKQDKQLGFAYRKKACELAQPNKFEHSKVALGCMKIGTMYYNGESVAKNKEMALKYFLKGCEVSPHNACSDYIKRFDEGYNGELIKVPQDYEFAFQLAEKGCKMNDGDSCNYLGILYGNGKGTTQDLKKAFWTFYKLCHQNEIYGTIGAQEIGCYNLGLSYAQGKGVEQSYKLAFEAFQKSCPSTDKEVIGKELSGKILFRSGYSAGCAMVGQFYYEAQGVRQDYRKAMEYFGKACDMGEQSGCDNHKMMKSNPYAYGLKADDFK